MCIFLYGRSISGKTVKKSLLLVSHLQRINQNTIYYLAKILSSSSFHLVCKIILFQFCQSVFSWVCPNLQIFQMLRIAFVHALVCIISFLLINAIRPNSPVSLWPMMCRGKENKAFQSYLWTIWYLLKWVFLIMCLVPHVNLFIFYSIICIMQHLHTFSLL